MTGYIGGDALHQIHTEHGDDLDYALLVRSEAKAEQVKNAFPSAHIVLGDLDNSKLLEDEAAKANIVLRKLIDTYAPRAAVTKGLTASRCS